MRMALKVGRCLKKSVIPIVVWLVLFSVYTFSVGTVSFTSDSVIQGRIFVRKAASIETSDTILGVENANSDRTVEDLFKRIHRSRAGNFTYVSSGSNTVVDTSRGRFRVIDKFLKKKVSSRLFNMQCNTYYRGALLFE